MSSLISWASVLTLALAVYAFPAWHIQWIGSLVYYFFVRHTLPTREPDQLFAPLVRTARCSPFAYDINGHKSNSTYFMDVDLSVGELIPRLASKSFNLRRRSGKVAFPRLGGVGGTFLKEIKLFQKYQLSSRVVSWDEKWVYVVTRCESPAEIAGKKEKLTFAILLSKVIFKQGRVTVPPQVVFEESGLIPTTDDLDVAQKRASASTTDYDAAEDLAPKSTKGKSWSRDDFEVERRRGLSYIKGILDFEDVRAGSFEHAVRDLDAMHSLW